ncbi:23S rRNA (cytosine1962-C5)-methyltransferase [Fervidobacterium changbaicum]|uniref:Class I SAM-dependent rRNA methyltransferase n=1 Tax=Fervidobacterium changbaicum TaxID=310769 RepID=A0ABX5QQE6_9BACT|nr:class I SAM-dependent rRNA methyltransferase [Fervidobacterium changbaicum]QAV32583.1 class I SAM-dependent rRNA methyltransferase [Fervidobacterium changbaicum]SDH66221.1 23S rRNA (cytosine1962-C5)-methyltransferase [Fervidobacterium changbaicum]
MDRRVAKVILKRDIKRRVLNGHPWVYDNEIERIEGNFEDGDIVYVYSFANQFVGIGYINTKSKITVRLLSRKPVEINREFIKNRILDAIKNRYSIAKENAYRVIFGEADGLPGLIVDKFDKYLSVQFNTLGINKLKNTILGVLIEIFSPTGIHERTEGSAVKKEGLEEFSGWIYGSGPELIPFEINGIKFLADTKGQKTGAFLDQRENARKLRDFAQNKVCLDCFSYTGNFGMHLLSGGAKHVTFVDYSDRAIEIARQIAKLNGFDESRTEFVVGNAFDYLKNAYAKTKKYDVVVLDPPSFAKSASSRDAAFKGYKEINYRSMRILKDDGLLATASCTQVVSQSEFESILVDAAIDAKVFARLIYRGGQPIDHPQVYNILETMYLKFLILQISSLDK